jgi:hypothetical protein
MLIRGALAAGFILPELATVLRERDAGGVPCGRVLELAKITELDEQIGQLTQLHAGTLMIPRYRTAVNGFFRPRPGATSCPLAQDRKQRSSWSEGLGCRDQIRRNLAKFGEPISMRYSNHFALRSILTITQRADR